MAITTFPRTGAVGSQGSLLHLPSWRSSGVGLRPALVFHALDADFSQAAQGLFAFADVPRFLAEQGFAVLAPTLTIGGAHSWSSDAVMAVVDSAYSNVVSVVGGVAGTTKVAILAWSGGGGDALNWIKRNPAKVARAWLYNPQTDLDWAYSLAGYTPAYSTSPYAGPLPNSAAWTSGLDAMFSGNYRANGGGYRIRDEYSSWRGIGVPIRISQQSDDATLPPAAAAAFVAGVNDAAVTLRSPSPTGGHTALSAIPVAEVVGWLAQP